VIRLISHELNNSLAPIQSLTHSAKKIINQQADNEMLLDILETIDRRSKHLHAFIEKYAKYARLPEPLKTNVDMDKFILSLEKICDIPIETENLARQAFFDPIQIEQVVINLVKNARESEGDNQAIRINISADSEGLIFTIKDRGKGMTEEQLKQSLLPFFTTKPSGSGLGLALCSDIINAHNGRLKLYNRENGGLTVIFVIPV
jgi:two-component system, NtrC family, nitrogen regulation sensor histidine kinase NtrY